MNLLDLIKPEAVKVIANVSSKKRLMQNLAESWQHGRQSPSFMAVEWEDYWHKDVETVRSELGISAFKGSFPADLLEQLAAVA